MMHPQEDQGDVTYHPKLEVQYAGEHAGEHEYVPWFADHADPGDPYLETVREELDHWLLNCLAWADLTLEPDPEVYVADEYFSLREARDDERSQQARDAVVADPTDELVEYERELATTRLLEDRPTDAEEDVLRAYADGGAADVDDLADRAGRSESTVYRTAQKFTDPFTTAARTFEARDQVVANRVRELFHDLDRDLSRYQQSIRKLARRGEAVDVEEHGRELTIQVHRDDYSDYELADVIREGAKHARAVGVNTFLAFAGASIRVAGQELKYALMPRGGGEWQTGVGGAPVDVHDGPVNDIALALEVREPPD